MAEKKIRNDASSSGSSSSSSSSGGNNRGESVVVDVGRRRSSCGYCRSGGHNSISHGLWAHSLTVDHYQALLDRGWRRSGCFLYKPEMEKTCCPSYTIRLKASDFAPSKEQLRVSKRMQRFLDGTLDVKTRDEVIDEPNTSKSQITSSEVRESLAGKNEEMNKAEQFMHYLSDKIDNAVLALIGSGNFPCDIQLPKASIKKVAPSKRKLLVEGSEDLLFSSNISFQIAAALMRAEKDKHDIKLSRDSAGKNGLCLELSPNIVAEKLTNTLNQLVESTGLSIRACNGHINFYSAKKQAGLDEVVQIVSISKESLTGSGIPGSFSKKISECPQGKRRRFELRLKRSSFDPEEYALYRRYQIKVHNDTPDQVTESSYKRFLIDSPLVYIPSTGNATVPPCGFGSFHQQYLIDGRLVAVGVVDILPKCLSSKYLFWDPDLAFLSLGKYSALQEIGWVKENQHKSPSLEYYYLGYYIHSCSKMRYKAAYRPSELLCPLRYQWVPFEITRPLLDKKPYVILSDFAILPNEESLALNTLENNMELQHDDLGQEDMNDILIDEDEEMAELDFEDSDDESGPESSGFTSVQLEDGSVSDTLIGLKGSRLRYKDLQHAFGPTERHYLETQLHRYTRAVGTELSKQMVYSLG
ncbi:arginyl-tRNA--protein transferase 2-like [Actinidia eriantha]|uniref:arginyl-tRNA--protein transferase 2-like n=1 Tax=Actinidia eriantha TaxID=165200 RepID=UPI00258D7DE1|nr:arginyl-tRNA--protein transferase 2-like [Actinidia eriantha]